MISRNVKCCTETISAIKRDSFKCIHSLAPKYLSDLIQIQVPGRQIRPSAYPMCKVPRTRIPSIGEQAFSVSGPKLWNKLPGTLHSITTLSLFRRNLKHFLYSEAFF